MKKCVVFIFAFYLALHTLTGCGLKNIRNSAKNSLNNTKVVDQNTLETKEQADTKETENTMREHYFKDLTPSFDLLGSVNFVTDKNQAKNITYKGEEVSVKVKDKSNITWKLTIPPGALAGTHQITITPLSNVKGTRIGGKLAGILLEPNGLVFKVPAALSLEGVKSDSLYMYSGNHNGSNITLQQWRQTNTGIQLPITHFSTQLAGTDFDLQNDPDLSKEIEEYTNTMLKQAEEILKKPVEFTAPPSVSLECYDDSSYLKIEEYIKQKLLMPEFGVVGMLTGCEAAYMNIDSAKAGNIRSVKMKLRHRILEKFDRFLKDNKGKQDKSLVAANTVFYFILANNSDTSSYENLVPICKPQYIIDINDWLSQTWDYLMDEIKQKHNYKMLRAANEIADYHDWISRMYGKRSDYLGELQRAMTFTYSYELVCDYKDNESSEDLDMDVRVNTGIKGEAELTFMIKENKFAKKLTGEGEGNYTSYSHTTPEKTTLILPNTFQFNAESTEFMPCKSEDIVITVDRIVADKETFSTSFGNVSEKMMLPLVESLLKDYYNENGKMEFEFELPNNSESAEISIEEEESGIFDGVVDAQIVCHMKLAHTPK